MGRIPKLVHYCFFSAGDDTGKQLGLSHYACIRSAITRLQPDRVMLYYDNKPSGPWWPKIREMVQPIRIEAPTMIFGNAITRPAHAADVVRLQKLIESGGIYLDLDMFIHRSFDRLLDFSAVLGREADAKLCNAVILAEPNAPFLRRWLDLYRDFRGSDPAYWNEHSVLRPAELARSHPEEVETLAQKAFYTPTFHWRELNRIFVSDAEIVGPETLATHLWEAASWDRFLALLTPGKVRRDSSNFGRWVTPLLDGLPDDFASPSRDRILATYRARIAGLGEEWEGRLGRLRSKLLEQGQ